MPTKSIGMIVCVDFDGTIVEHRFPEIGDPAPGAFEWLKRLAEAGARLILWTMRSDGQKHGDVLKDAVEFCREQGVEFWGVNANPEQDWSSSPKCYAHVYVDDAAHGCPLVLLGSGRRVVDWEVVGPELLAVAEAWEKQ